MYVARSTASVSLKFNGDNEFEEGSGKLSEDFGAKLKLNVLEEDRKDKELRNRESRERTSDGEDDDEGKNLEVREKEREQENGEDDFSFTCVNPDGSPIAAEEAFKDGQIRAVFPLFNRDLLFSDQGYSDGLGLRTDDSAPSLRPPLKKLFVEEHDEDAEPQGPYCEWTRKTVQETSHDACRKSNSTGFSKLWRFRDLVSRSSSDGRDAFVFLNSSNGAKAESSSTKAVKPNREKADKADSRKMAKGKSETTSSAHERHYVRNRAMREGDKHRSYLPYKQAGFFANVNGLTRNVHPY